MATNTRTPETTSAKSRSDPQQSDTPIGLALAKLAIAATNYYDAIIGPAHQPNVDWAKARSNVLACALDVGRKVEQEVRQLADTQRPWPVPRTGDKARS